jgi:hypothetical protein
MRDLISSRAKNYSRRRSIRVLVDRLAKKRGRPPVRPLPGFSRLLYSALAGRRPSPFSAAFDASAFPRAATWDSERRTLERQLGYPATWDSERRALERQLGYAEESYVLDVQSFGDGIEDRVTGREDLVHRIADQTARRLRAEGNDKAAVAVVRNKVALGPVKLVGDKLIAKPFKSGRLPRPELELVRFLLPHIRDYRPMSQDLFIWLVLCLKGDRRRDEFMDADLQSVRKLRGLSSTKEPRTES